MNNPEQNLNTDYHKTLDGNFNSALELFRCEIPHTKLLTMLQDGNIPQRQIAALKLSHIQNITEAKILVSNLTGQDGKIREAVSSKVLEFMQNPEFSVYFYDKDIYDILLYALADINSNVCRNIVSAISLLKVNPGFCAYFTGKLLTLTGKLVDKVKEFDFQEGKYKVNKEVFKLYWYLEGIYHLTEYIETEKLKQIIRTTKNINEYTIREKTAKILSKNYTDKELLAIRAQLKNDKNYYVRRF